MPVAPVYSPPPPNNKNTKSGFDNTLLGTISNWSGDLKDSELYAVLLGQLEPKRIGSSLVSRTLEEDDLHRRAEIVLSAAEQLGCRKFVTPNEIVQVIMRIGSFGMQ